MSIRNTGELVKQARKEGRADAVAKLRRLRAEVRRLRGWNRHIRYHADLGAKECWVCGHIFCDLEMVVDGEPVPRDPAPKGRRP